MNKQYNQDYYDLMLKNNSECAEKIARIRWDFVNGITPSIVLDYGSGIGAFRAFAPIGIIVDTFDINCSAASTGIRNFKYDLVTLWDVFEHLEDFSFFEKVLAVTDYVALSVPVLPEDKNLFTWKHFKPGEHLYQCNPKMIEAIFNEWGFEKVKDGWPESESGIREDIYSVLFGKVKKGTSLTEVTWNEVKIDETHF